MSFMHQVSNRYIKPYLQQTARIMVLFVAGHYDKKQVRSTPHTTDVIVLAVLGSELRPEKKKKGKEKKKEKASASERKQ